MFIKLTNASPPFQNKTVVLKKDNIVSIFETDIEVPIVSEKDEVIDLLKEKVTAIFCGTVGIWYVKETLEEIYKSL